MNKYLTQKRDELAENYQQEMAFVDSQHRPEATVIDYQAGWSDCYELLRPDIEELVEALNACSPAWIPSGIRDQRRTALKNWADKYGEKI